MLRWLEFAVGVYVWLGVLWDGFATIVLPRTVAPMTRFSGRFNRLTWRFWAAISRKISDTDRRLSFLAVYGPISVMALLVLWGALMIVAFTMIFHGLGPRFHATVGPVNFGTLFYMSASNFLTLGLGDVTSADPIGRTFIILEAATGYIFLGLIITYMPLLDQAYGSREIGNSLIHSRAGDPPGAIALLRKYAAAGHDEVLRGNLREAERWIAELQQTHLSHPVISFYRAQHWGRSWLVSFTTIMDSSALLIAGGDGLPAVQARLTYRMGISLLKDLSGALSIAVDSQGPGRLAEADLPALIEAASASGLNLKLGSDQAKEVYRLARRYDVYVVALAEWLVIPLPLWIPPTSSQQAAASSDDDNSWDD